MTPPPIPLHNPYLAAFLAWLVPGLGHIYQKRTAKGLAARAVKYETFPLGDSGGAQRERDCRYPEVVDPASVASLGRTVAGASRHNMATS